MKCHYCNKERPVKGIIWSGFQDKDMSIYVGWCCHNKHYAEKQKTEYEGLYSEFPVVIPKKQLELF